MNYFIYPYVEVSGKEHPTCVARILIRRRRYRKSRNEV